MTTALHASTRDAAQGLTGNQDDHAIQVVRTVADLTAILASLPSHMPVRLDPILRSAPGLPPDKYPQVVLANANALMNSISGSRVDRRRPLPVLELGACLVAEDGAPVPTETQACEPIQQMRDALDAGDLGSALRALADTLSDAAREVVAEGTAWLPPDSPQSGELHDLAASIRHIAADMGSRLASAVDAEMQRAELL